MNKQRRQEIQNIINSIEAIRPDIESVLNDEREYRDNMPENLQSSEKYDIADAAVDNLESATEAIESLVEYLSAAAE